MSIAKKLMTMGIKGGGGHPVPPALSSNRLLFLNSKGDMIPGEFVILDTSAVLDATPSLSVVVVYYPETFGGQHYGIATDNNAAICFTEDGANTFQSFDVSKTDPSESWILGTVTASNSHTCLHPVYDVETKTYYGDSTHIGDFVAIDYTDVSTPAVLYAEGVATNGSSNVEFDKYRKLIFSFAATTLSIIDVSDPSAPYVRATGEYPYSLEIDEEGEFVSPVFLSYSYLHQAIFIVAGASDCPLGYFNTSNLDSLTFTCTPTTEVIDDPRHVAQDYKNNLIVIAMNGKIITADISDILNVLTYSATFDTSTVRTINIDQYNKVLYVVRQTGGSIGSISAYRMQEGGQFELLASVDHAIEGHTSTSSHAYLTAFFSADHAPIEPTITSTPVTDGEEDVEYSYDVNATGTEPITYSLETFPTNMVINSSTGIITWTPDSSQTGSNDVEVKATNSVGDDSQTFAIDVAAKEIPPTITSTPSLSGEEGTEYTYDTEATGTAPITFSLDTFPTGMTIASDTGVVTWTPTSGQVGDNNVVVRATNNAGDDTQPFTVNVTAQAVAPSITSTPILDGEEAVEYTYDVEATGTAPITFSLNTSPTNMVIASDTGIITWTPDATQVGDNEVEVNASNSAGNDTQPFTINVEAQGVAPDITSTPVLTGEEGVAYTYDVDATGTAPIVFALPTFPTNMTIASDTGIISWTPDGTQLGDNAVEVSATNDIGNDSQTFTIDVAESAPPTGDLTLWMTDNNEGTTEPTLQSFDVSDAENGNISHLASVLPADLNDDRLGNLIIDPARNIGFFGNAASSSMMYAVDLSVPSDSTNWILGQVLVNDGYAMDMSALAFNAADNLIYAGGSASKELFTVDVADPANMMVVGSDNASNNLRGDTVFDQTKKILYAGTDDKMYAYDVTDASNVVELAEYAHPTLFPFKGSIFLDTERDILIVGSRDGLGYLDLSDLAAWEYVSLFDDTQCEPTFITYDQTNKIVIGTTDFDTDGTFVYRFDISDLASPTISSYDVSGTPMRPSVDSDKMIAFVPLPDGDTGIDVLDYSTTLTRIVLFPVDMMQEYTALSSS